LFKATD